MIRKRNIELTEVAVTVDAGETVGTATVLAGQTIVGFVPTAQDQVIESIAISGTTLTVTMAAAATADNTFTVNVIK